MSIEAQLSVEEEAPAIHRRKKRTFEQLKNNIVSVLLLISVIASVLFAITEYINGRLSVQTVQQTLQKIQAIAVQTQDSQEHVVRNISESS